MKNLTVVESNVSVLGQSFNIYGDFENPLFLAKDVAEWIENPQPSQMVEVLDEAEKLICKINTSGQNRDMWFITEDGLYEVLMLSRKPIAKQFKAEVKKLLKGLRTKSLTVVPFHDDDLLLEFMANTKKLIEDKKALQLQIAQKVEVISEQQVLLDCNDGYATVLGHCLRFNIEVPSKSESQQIGKTLTKLCKTRKLDVKTAQDERYGRVNSYPVSILNFFFNLDSN